MKIRPITRAFVTGALALATIVPAGAAVNSVTASLTDGMRDLLGGMNVSSASGSNASHPPVFWPDSWQ